MLVTVLISSCAVSKKLEIKAYFDIFEPLYSAKDIAFRDKIIDTNIKINDSCKKHNIEYRGDLPVDQHGSFYGGTENFFKLFYSNFKDSFHYKSSVTSIDFIINREGKIENIVVHSKNKKLKKEINRILRLECMNKWKTSLIGGRIKLKGGNEIRFIETKMQMRLILKKIKISNKIDTTTTY